VSTENFDDLRSKIKGGHVHKYTFSEAQRAEHEFMVNCYLPKFLESHERIEIPKPLKRRESKDVSKQQLLRTPERKHERRRSSDKIVREPKDAPQSSTENASESKNNVSYNVIPNEENVKSIKEINVPEDPVKVVEKTNSKRAVIIEEEVEAEDDGNNFGTLVVHRSDDTKLSDIIDLNGDMLDTWERNLIALEKGEWSEEMAEDAFRKYRKDRKGLPTMSFYRTKHQGRVLLRDKSRSFT